MENDQLNFRGLDRHKTASRSKPQSLHNMEFLKSHTHMQIC